jgi:hypothetical protein
MTALPDIFCNPQTTTIVNSLDIQVNPWWGAGTPAGICQEILSKQALLSECEIKKI